MNIDRALRTFVDVLWYVASLIFLVYFALGTPWEDLVRLFMGLLMVPAFRIMFPERGGR